MAKFTSTFFFAVAFALFAVFYVATGNDVLQNGKKYKIIAVANDLVMTAEQGKFSENLGIVHLEQFVNATNQKWKYSFERKVSVFKSEENTYNNVTTKHEKGSFHVYNDFVISKNDDNVYTLQQKTTQKTKNNPQCLQSMGKGQAVQLLPCDAESEDQKWKFELLPCCKKD